MKVALVTGASRGLGRAIATALASDGWAVAVNFAHVEAGAAQTIADAGRAGGFARAARFDVTEPTAVSCGIAAIAADLGPVDLIVNNATGIQGAQAVMEQDWADYQRHLDFFVKAPFLLLQAVLPDWRARRSGRIINIGSVVTRACNAGDSHYVAAKAAMVGLTRCWAAELGPDGITVNLVSPGWVPVERHLDTDPASLERRRRAVPPGRMGTPQDIARTVAFVASSAADYITGGDIGVNGGKA